jgi:hypothetical protein
MDTTFGIWDYEALEVVALNCNTSGDLWERFCSRDARVGLAAVRELSARPGEAVALLRRRLLLDEPQTVEALVDKLGHTRFEIRERAEVELKALGLAADRAIRVALRSPSPEIANRAGRILRAIRGDVTVCSIRSVEVLERIDTLDSRRLLTEWARFDDPLGREAQAALRRGVGPEPAR